MNILARVKKKLNLFYHREIKRDIFLREVRRWFRDKGDKTLRLDYPLNANSTVFDLGGYQGDFAAEIVRLYDCNIYIFEPAPEFYKRCVERFKTNPKVMCFNYGLSSKNDWLDIRLAGDASSFYSPHANRESTRVEIRDIVSTVNELKIDNIELIKINIEGGEFEVIPVLIESGLINNIINLQIQFHNFVPNASAQRNSIRENLAKTHEEKWCYEFVWESWCIKQ